MIWNTTPNSIEYSTVLRNPFFSCSAQATGSTKIDEITNVPTIRVATETVMAVNMVNIKLMLLMRIPANLAEDSSNVT